MLGVLSVLNYLMGGLYALGSLLVLVLSVIGTSRNDMGPVVVGLLLIVFLTLAGLHLYTAVGIEKGHGRTTQTILAVLSLFSIPVGTAFGLFALYVVWSAEAELFNAVEAGEAPPRADDERAPRPRVRSSADDGLTPYQAAKELVAGGATARDVQFALRDRGLEEEEIETLMTSLKLRYSRTRR